MIYALLEPVNCVHRQMQKFILNTKVVCSSLLIFALCGAKFAIDFLFRLLHAFSLFLYLFIGFEYVLI